MTARTSRSTGKWVRLGVPALVLALLALAAGTVAAAAPTAAAGAAPALFGAATQERAAPTAAHVARSRYVTVNLGALIDDSGTSRVAAGGTVTLNLFDDATYTGVVDKVELTPGGYNWAGTVPETGGVFYLVSYDGAFMAHVASTAGVYEVSLAPDGRYRAVQIDQSKLIDDPEGAVYPAPGPVLSASDLGPGADSGAVIDIMVVYTAAARLGAGGTPAMKAAIALALLETNTSYENSGVVPRLRLVHIQELPYSEPGDLFVALNDLMTNGDGKLDAVFGLRNQYGADMVGLVVENDPLYCGLAAAILADASTAFQVTRRDGCLTGYYSFGHEFGHLQGARHDWYVDTDTTPFQYGHGYVHPESTNPSKQWRTIMAYNNKCSEVFGYYCTRIPYWSNPNVDFGGLDVAADATGVQATRNFRVLNETAATVANFRAQKIAGAFNSNLNSGHAGWSVLSGSWAHGASAYYHTGGVADDWAAIVHDGNYGDITYEARMKRLGCVGCANALIIRGTPDTSAEGDFWPSYRFQFSNDGDFAVVRIQADGTAVYLQPWTLHAAVVVGGWNTLKVVAVGNFLRFYINGTKVWQGTNNALKVGRVGITMFRQAGTTSNDLRVDSAKLTNTPTADISYDGPVVPGTAQVGK
jgi:hypothetical protein